MSSFSAAAPAAPAVQVAPAAQVIPPSIMACLDNLYILTQSDLYEMDANCGWDCIAYAGSVPAHISLYPESRFALDRLFKATRDYCNTLESQERVEEFCYTLIDKMEEIEKDLPDDSSCAEDTCDRCGVILRNDTGPLCYDCVDHEDHKLKEKWMKKGIPCKSCGYKYKYENRTGHIICRCYEGLDY